jgi:hypothetical protein
MAGMGTAMLFQQMMAAQNAAAHNNANGNCSCSPPQPGMDMQAIMPIILAMQNQGAYRGGNSGWTQIDLPQLQESFPNLLLSVKEWY